MSLIAETDWNSVVTAVIAAVTTILGAGGAAFKYMLGYMDRQRELHQAHADALMDRMEAMMTASNTVISKIHSENREESRATQQTLLGIQQKTVDAVGELAKQVHALGAAISELRTEVARKADRHEVLAVAGVTGVLDKPTGTYKRPKQDHSTQE